MLIPIYFSTVLCFEDKLFTYLNLACKYVGGSMLPPPYHPGAASFQPYAPVQIAAPPMGPRQFYPPPIFYWPYPSPPVSPTSYYAPALPPPGAMPAGQPQQQMVNYFRFYRLIFIINVSY